MPKSRKKGKHSFQGNKKIRTNQKTTFAQQSVAAQTQGSVSRTGITAPLASTAGIKPGAVSFPYIATELRTIAILTVIMLIILVVLALVLS